MSILKLVGVGLFGAGCVVSALMYRESSSGSCCPFSGGSMVSSEAASACCNATSSYCDSGAASCIGCPSDDADCTAQCPSSVGLARASEVSDSTAQTDIGDVSTALSDGGATPTQSLTIDFAPAREEK
ncbi:MAG: hypothetical protein ACK52L_11105 [Pirellula sp.]